MNIMIDLETYSTANNAVILSIGAIKFSLHDKSLPELDKLDTFYRKIDIQSCVDLGMDINLNTVNWWNNQTEDAKSEVFSLDNRIPITQAIQEFIVWFGNANNFVWANGIDFDCVILSNAIELCKCKVPWNFWNVMDCRTVMKLYNIRLADIKYESLIKHHSLHDCYRQILGLRKALKK
jgi:hypothetical protein